MGEDRERAVNGKGRQNQCGGRRRDAVEGKELGVGAALGDGTVVEDDDLVGVGDGGEAVCDVDGGASGRDAGKSVLDLALASR